MRCKRATRFRSFEGGLQTAWETKLPGRDESHLVPPRPQNRVSCFLLWLAFWPGNLAVVRVGRIPVCLKAIAESDLVTQT
jgi:hypothetical protein